MELVKKDSTLEEVKDAIEYVRRFFRTIERFRMCNAVELSVTSRNRIPLDTLQDLLGGRVQHRKLNSRWYIRPSCPSFEKTVSVLQILGWTGMEVKAQVKRTKMEKAADENFQRLLETLQD